MNKYGLLGHHLSHSLSPLIHSELLKQNNINATYELIEIEEVMLKDYIDKLRAGIYCGYNVTIPYKEKVIPYLDELTDAAQTIGAVNTIYLHDTKVIGDNTDYYGFIKQLEMQKINVNNKHIFVLGDGGASKAICYALRLLGAVVTVVSRKANGISYADLKDINHFDVIVNTTPLGMYPNIDVAAVSKEIISKSDYCVDIIFNPKRTLFLKYANQDNNGLDMLIFQAIRAQEKWQNKRIDYDYQNLKLICERKLEAYE